MTLSSLDRVISGHIVSKRRRTGRAPAAAADLSPPAGTGSGAARDSAPSAAWGPARGLHQDHPQAAAAVPLNNYPSTLDPAQLQTVITPMGSGGLPTTSLSASALLFH